MIKVLHVVGCMNLGGIETMLMNYYKNFNRNRLQFDFLILSGAVGKYDEEIRSLGGNLFYAPVPYDFRNPFPLIKYFKSIIIQNKFDILHSHNCGAFILFKIAKQHLIKVAVHSHNTKPITSARSIKYYLRILGRRISYKYVDAFFACSEEAGHYMFGSSKFTVIRNAIEITKFIYNEDIRHQIRRSLGINNEFVIGTVGRLTIQKNPDMILNIFQNFFASHSNSKLLWIGTGELKDEIHQKIRDRHLDKNIILPGDVRNVHEMLQAMDAFILPSLYEGLGIVSIEAQASGLPTLCSDCIPEEAKITDLCQFIPLDDSHAWVSRLDSLATHREGRIDMSEAIRKHGYDVRQEAEKLADIYKGMIG